MRLLIDFTMKTIFLSLGLTIMLFMMGSASVQAQCCTYRLHTFDSYGDGWNGGSLEVFVNGSSLGQFSAALYGSDFTIPVCNGDNISFNYTAGNYENENSYVLADSLGLVIFQDGPDPATGNSFSGNVTCGSGVTGEFPCLAIPVTVGGCAIGDNTGLATSGWTPNCANYQGEDVWFSTVVPASGSISATTMDQNGMDDSGLALWTGTMCSGLTLQACDDDGGNGYFSQLILNGLTAGETVYFQVFSYGGGTPGAIELCINDNAVPFSDSELPIVVIETGGQPIPDEPKITADMKIIYNGVGNLTAVTDPPNVYDGKVGIEIRGASSAGYPQKPYGFETRDSLGNNNNVSLLNMPMENDWVLLSNYNDKAFVRNMLAQDAFQKMGRYGPRMTLCEVVKNGIYEGIYVFGEKIKRDNGRVDIARLDTFENTGDDVTGGYILKTDYWNNGNSWQSPYSPLDHPTYDVHFVYHYPDENDITPAQESYLQTYIDSLEDALYGPNFADTGIGYRKYMDEGSFIDYLLVNELSRNNDGFKKSRYYHKDKYSKGGKLHAGPTWDFDWAWKNISQCSVFANTDGSGWAHHINDCNPDVNAPGWYIRLWEDTTFTNQLRCRWDELRTDWLDSSYYFNYIDSVATLVGNAQARHYQRWPTLGNNVGAPEVGPIPTTFQGEIDALKSWIALRITWLDQNIPGTCRPEAPVGLEENQSLITAKLYPNPSHGQMTLALDGLTLEETTLTIVNALGQTVWQQAINSPRTALDLRSAKAGVYQLIIQHPEGRTAKTFVIR